MTRHAINPPYEFEICIARDYTLNIFRRYADGRLRFHGYAHSWPAALAATQGRPTTIFLARKREA